MYFSKSGIPGILLIYKMLHSKGKTLGVVTFSLAPMLRRRGIRRTLNVTTP